MSNIESLQEGSLSSSNFFGRIAKVESLETPFTAVRRYHAAERRLEAVQEELVILKREDGFANGLAIAEKSSEVNELSRQVENGPGIRRRVVLFDIDRLSFPVPEARPSKEEKLQRQASKIAREEAEQAFVDFAGREMPTEVAEAIEKNERIARGFE